MIRRRSFATVFSVLVFSTAAGLSSAQARDIEGRFAMQQTDGGMLRLDTVTGAMSLCQSRDGAWACARIEDDSAGLQMQLRDIKRENLKLRNEIKELKSTATARLESPVDAPPRDLIPDDKDIDRAFSFLDRVLKRFRGMVEDLRTDRPDGTPL